MATSSMFSLVFVCWFCLKVVSANTIYTIDTNITTTKFLRDPETLESTHFMIGFFSPINSTNRYVGIWYKNQESDVVWVANRNDPIKDNSGVLKVSEDGNLLVLDGQNQIHWSSNLSHQRASSVAYLLDNGNLVLCSSASGTIIWQSFENLTNSLLPQTNVSIFDKGNMQENSVVLRSWKSASEPSNGRFSLGISNPSTHPGLVISDGDKVYWRTGPWCGDFFLGVNNLVPEASIGYGIINNVHEGTLEIFANRSILAYYVLNYDGNLFLKNWDDGSQNWEIQWQSIDSECDIYGKCGPFGLCNPKDDQSEICSCLHHYEFEPKNIDEWRKGNWTSGCKRRTPLNCGNNTGSNDDGFFELKNIKVPDFPNYVLAADQDDCRRKCLGNCSCIAYAYRGIGCMTWSEKGEMSLIDVQQFTTSNSTGISLFIRLHLSEPDKHMGKPSIDPYIVIGVTVTATFGIFAYLLWRWIYHQYGQKSSNNVTHLVGLGMDRDEFKDLTLFQFKKLVTATSNFSVTKKLGQGGFGPVYKGKLENGQEIAVKRLSKSSGQGPQEFMNEVLVISKLQHNNLVKLLGCCVEQEEKLLVYEYMSNRSLDALLFDPNHQKQLDWKKRYNIINGICRGLLYLHRDSRWKIIHRDLKASNILLDEELNPKISDFGMARIFGTKQNKASTLRVVGTYGYMSPEYAMEGLFSEKSDVYSLGVLLLEIVSGRKNRLSLDSESLNLLTNAWKLWNENDMLSLIDQAIYDPCYEDEILKCIHLGLLCVQEFPEDRPAISVLISMLEVNDMKDLPLPKQPGFTQRNVSSTDESPKSGQEYGSVNHVSLTILSGR